MLTDLEKLLKRSIKIVRKMTPAERAEMLRVQGESWARGEAPCEHGNEWDACDKCWEPSK